MRSSLIFMELSFEYVEPEEQEEWPLHVLANPPARICNLEQ